MADERDRLRRQLGLAPLPTQIATPVVDERTQAKAKTFTDDQLEAVRAQIEAADALAAAKKVNIDLAKQLGAKIDPATGKIDKTTIPKIQSGGKTVVSVTYEGTGKNRIKITKYSDGTETRESAPEAALRAQDPGESERAHHREPQEVSDEEGCHRVPIWRRRLTQAQAAAEAEEREEAHARTRKSRYTARCLPEGSERRLDPRKKGSRRRQARKRRPCR